MAGWIKKSIRHKGVEIERAREHGISTHQQLERDAHSKSKTLRARGNLGLRFEKGGDLHHDATAERAKRRYGGRK